MIKLILVILSILGYYAVYKNYKMIAYILFIVQNVIAFCIVLQPYMIINMLACLIFLIKTKQISKQN